MVRGAILPPFPPSMPSPEIEISVTVRFGLTNSLQPAPVTVGDGAVATPITSETDAYAQGIADWQALQAWTVSQTGDRRAGADFWAANRSDVRHPTCAEAGDKYAGDKASFVAGCLEAAARINLIDVRRANPQYRAGFNDEAKRLPLASGAASSSAPTAKSSPPIPTGQPGARITELPPQPAVPATAAPTVASAGCPVGFHDAGLGCVSDHSPPATAKMPLGTAIAPEPVPGSSEPSPLSSSWREDFVIKGAVVIALVLIGIASFVGYFLYRIAKQQQSESRIQLNPRDLPPVGASGVISLPIVNGHGKVRISGKVWLAEGPNIPKGTKVIIKSVKGRRIFVEAMAIEHATAAI
jgi:membrane protein implicated in regulation of membrane protease activity